MSDSEQTTEDLQAEQFLVRLHQIVGADTSRKVNAATVGQELDLPLERTLAIVERLGGSGALHRCSKLIDGPLVHLTTAGVERAERLE